MSTTSDTAAQAAIGAAARELHLPTVRTQATRLAEIAVRQRQSHLVFLAEVLAAEVDDRGERRRARRIAEAHFPRLKRLAEFNIDAAPTIDATQIATLATGNYLTAGEPIVLLGDSGTGKATCSSDSAWPPANKAAESATSPPPNWSTNSSKPPTTASCLASCAATAA